MTDWIEIRGRGGLATFTVWEAESDPEGPVAAETMEHVLEIEGRFLGGTVDCSARRALVVAPPHLVGLPWQSGV